MNIPYKEIFREKNFGFILSGRLLKRSALILFSIELIWLTMELTNNSPLYLSLMTMAETLPFIILGIYGGVKADRWNKKKVMIISNTCVAILLFTIPFLEAIGSLNYFILMALAVGITIFNCFSEPSFRAILPELLTESQLQEGNALLDSVQRGVSILVPASIGIVLKLTTQIHLFTLAAILMVAAVIFQLLIRYAPKAIKTIKDEEDTSTLNDIKNTFSYLKINKGISYLMVAQGLSILINTGLWRVGLPIYLESYLGKDISTFGYITGIMGAASFSTSIILGLIKRFNPISAFNLGVILWGIGILVIGLFPSINLIYLATILIGVGQASEGLARVVILQTKVPANMLGKVFSTSSSLNYASDTISLGAISSILAIFSTAVVFSGGGVIILTIGVIGIFTLKEETIKNEINQTENQFDKGVG